MINKVLAGALTVGFMMMVRPDPEATNTGMIFASLLLFAGLDYCIGYIREMNKKHYIDVPQDNEPDNRVSKGDIDRWSDTWLRWPMKEVN